MLECVSDKDELVAVYAAVALSQLPSRHESVVPALTSTWNDPRTTVRFGFIRTLAWHTPRSEVVLPVLTIALNDPNPDVRREATNAILQIAPEILTNVPAK
ncbi:MAG TPA: HEAT repeat domain-containing protein [Verrucomicrobiae bacterium]|nr:HEAT repeat domain-containing protein [Verrucomicrobiae bacterium]